MRGWVQGAPQASCRAEKAVSVHGATESLAAYQCRHQFTHGQPHIPRNLFPLFLAILIVPISLIHQLLPNVLIRQLVDHADSLQADIRVFMREQVDERRDKGVVVCDFRVVGEWVLG